MNSINRKGLFPLIAIVFMALGAVFFALILGFTIAPLVILFQFVNSIFTNPFFRWGVIVLVLLIIAKKFGLLKKVGL